MNRAYLTKVAILFAMSLGLATTADAELLTKVTVQQNNVSADYNMYSTGKMYFSGSNLVIDTLGNGNTVQTSLASIDKLLFSTFEYTPSGVVKVINDASALEVNPNPASDYITVAGVNGTFTYQVYTTAGQLILEGNAAANEQINVSALSKGIYLLRVNGSILKFSKL